MEKEVHKKKLNIKLQELKLKNNDQEAHRNVLQNNIKRTKKFLTISINDNRNFMNKKYLKDKSFMHLPNASCIDNFRDTWMRTEPIKDIVNLNYQSQIITMNSEINSLKNTLTNNKSEKKRIQEINEYLEEIEEQTDYLNEL